MTEPHDILTHWKAAASDECRALLEAVAALDTGTPATIEKLRANWSSELIAVAVELIRARRKAQRKFSNADHLIADVAGVEQATSELVAAHKAARLRRLRDVGVLDLCSGIGGDAMALARVIDVKAVDTDPVRAWMTSTNANCVAQVADVGSTVIADRVVHIDPGRRDTLTGVRRRRLDEYEPGPGVLRRVIHEAAAAAVKLGPGIDWEDLARLVDGVPNEVEIINERGTLVQVVLWTGGLAHHDGLRTATRLPSGATFTASPTPMTSVDPPREGACLLTVDPAIERAELMGALASSLDLPAIHPALGALLADGPIDSPWLTPFTIRAVMPWRVKRVRAWLDAHDAGIIEVKTRGGAVDPDVAQRQLRGEGDRPFTVFVLRFDRSLRAVITERVVQPGS